MDNPSPEALLFPGESGHPTNASYYRQYGLQPALEKAGITKDITPHGLRHTFASMLIDMGKNVAEVAKIMGHTIAVCQKTYIHLIERKDKKDKTMVELDRYMENG